MEAGQGIIPVTPDLAALPTLMAELELIAHQCAENSGGVYVEGSMRPVDGPMTIGQAGIVFGCSIEDMMDMGPDDERIWYRFDMQRPQVDA